MNPLELFYRNEVEREAVKAFMKTCLRDVAADLALEGESTDGIKDAGVCVDKMFDTLESLYTTEKKSNSNSR
jgi:hypothetical protein